ncbi:MAG: Arc family DNA-binding protein [Candidatus Cloacimonetes bacterium]|nr:Arc family DNA-binding protein [Candidatus Cloacimonadota bacterium]
MNVLTIRLPEEIEKKLKIKARMEHRSVSEQIKKYLSDAILMEDNPDLPLSFIKETLEAKAEIEAGLGKEYQFGHIK